jgi:ABC-type sugar transport system substrate-binding protein
MASWQWYEVSLVVITLSLLLGLLFVNQMSVAYRKRLLFPLYVALVIGVIFLSVVVFEKLGYTFSDAVSIIGLISAFFLGLGGGSFIERRRYTELAVVIPSKAPFNVELRSGLAKRPEGLRLNISDPFAEVAAEYEGLSEFIPAVQRAVSTRPDYLLLHAPTAGQVASEEFQKAIRRMTSRGGRVLCVEVAPDNMAKFNGLVTKISSDTKSGAAVLANYALSVHRGSGYVLNLAGPDYSPQSIERNAIFKNIFENANIEFKTKMLPGWTKDGCYQATLIALRAEHTPEIIFCGNDTMALGAVEATREVRLRSTAIPKIFGYDGLKRAMFAIGEPDNPFYATIRTPPSVFGERAISLIWEELNDAKQPFSDNFDVQIHIDGANLITKDNCDKLIESL